MSEFDSGADARLRSDLAEYFAITTAAALPAGVRRLSARTLGRRQARRDRWFAAGGALATAALVAVAAVAVHLHPSEGNSTASSAGSAAQAPALAAPQYGGKGVSSPVVYPGVDTGLLAGSGVLRLETPAGHGSAAVTPTTAQGIAAAGAGAAAGAPGPAVLAWAVEPGTAAAPCLCWVVDVPVTGGVPRQPPSGGRAMSELVLVDAVSGRVVAALTAAGIP